MDETLFVGNQRDFEMDLHIWMIPLYYDYVDRILDMFDRIFNGNFCL